MNGILRKPLRPRKSGASSNAVRQLLLPLPLPLCAVRLLSVLSLAVLALLLTGCATNSERYALTPANPPPPQPSLSPPSQSYLSNARENISAWRKRLIDMLATQKQ